jgi:hypothetical protein
MVFEIFVISAMGVWFAAFMLLFFVSLVWASEKDSFLLGTSVILVGAAVGEFVFGLPIIASIIANPFTLVVYVTVYIAFGALYAGLWRLPNFVKKNSGNIQSSYITWKDRVTTNHERSWRVINRDRVTRTKKHPEPADVPFDEFLNSSSNGHSVRNNKDRVTGTEEHPEPADVSFDAFLNSSSYGYSVRNNKDRVASWVLLWPASLTWELMHKPFIWLWNSVYFSLGEVFERINRDSARKVLEEKNK